MQTADVVGLVSYGLTHDADRALGRLLAAGGSDEPARAATAFLCVLSCRFDDALDTALALQAHGRLSPLGKAAADLAIAVCAGVVTTDPGGPVDDGPLGDLTAILQVEAAMSSGLIATAAQIAERIVDTHGIDSVAGIWSGLALARAWCFEGRIADVDPLVDRLLAVPALPGWPQLHLLARGVRIFVDGHLGRADAVCGGLADLRQRCPEASGQDYVFAGAHVLAAFGANAMGSLAEASQLVLRGGGGEHLPHLQIVDRLYGYEILVEDALARHDVMAAHDWSEHALGLPVAGHQMASAALGRIRARLSVALADTQAGIRESTDSGASAAVVGGDLEVIRARILEASARAASGDRLRGIEELEEVARRAGAVGAASVRAWAERELRSHGQRLRNVPGHGWDALSVTQQAVARLAAAGLRNREIAEMLWLSDKTIESHVAAVLGALGASNRVSIGRELGGAAVDPQFGPDLTSRQRQVAVLVAEGRSNGEISTILGISDKTVEKHIAGLFERLGVRTRAAIGARVRGARTRARPAP